MKKTTKKEAFFTTYSVKLHEIVISIASGPQYGLQSLGIIYKIEARIIRTL